MTCPCGLKSCPEIFYDGNELPSEEDDLRTYIVTFVDDYVTLRVNVQAENEDVAMDQAHALASAFVGGRENVEGLTIDVEEMGD